MATSDQCALGSDGKLLDASEIAWVYDPDDPTLIEPIQQADGIFPSSSNSSAIHPLFRGGPPPATMVAGSRRSNRVSHPSKRVLDPDNSERPDALKRPRPSRQKIVESDSDDNCVDDGNGDGAATDAENAVIDTDVDSEMVDTDFEAVDEAYVATKAMGDTDREVRSIPSRLLTLVYFINIPLIYHLGPCESPKV